ncbi:TNF receptor-associated factor 2-like isoform X2 [Haemaphysalis longicornis]
MSSNGEEWGILGKLTAACPNDNPKCTYQGTFKDVLVHYKSCALKTKVECPLCKSFHDRKILVTHMAENCPKRVVECKFCNSDIEAWEKEIHEGSCRHRPGTCNYCLQEFLTNIELEEEHQPQCPKMPVKCSFYQLGCSFSAARSDVVVHEASSKHTDMLVEHVCLLKAENETKIENRTNVAFERREGFVEPHFVRYDPYGINAFRTSLEGEQASAGTRQRDIEERLAAVEEKLRSYQLPFEQLLRSISDLK